MRRFNILSHMNRRAPYEAAGYRVDDFLVGYGEPSGNWLLDGDGVPYPDPISPSVAGLAALAAAIHKHAGAMEPVHLEKAVWWLKDWKMHQSRAPENSPRDFYLAMERVKPTLRRKPNDLHFFLQCLSLARCTGDLLDLGLFADLPAVTNSLKTGDEQGAWRAAREMQRQLADALYFDHDFVLRRSFSDDERAEARANVTRE